MKQFNTRIAIYTTIVVFLIIFYAITTVYPLSGDDWTYRYIFTTDTLVGSLSDVLYSQQIHWFRWGGRFVAHTMVQSSLLLDKCWYNIANTICYALCCFLIVKLTFHKNILFNYLLVLLSFWLLMPSPNGTMFWLTGSFNYLWPSMFTVAFLCLLFSQKRWGLILSIPVAIVAGNGHESISLGVSAMLILYAFIAPRRPLIFYVSIACFVIGMLSNALAPGNFVRFESVTASGSSYIYSLLLKYSKYFLKVCYRLTFNWSDLGVQCCTILWTTAAAVCIRKRKEWASANASYILMLCFTIGALASLGLNVLSGTAYSRSVYGFCFLAYLTFLFSVSFMGYGKLNKCLLMLALVANTVFIPIAWRDVNIFHENVKKSILCCKNGTHIVIAHKDSGVLKNSRFASYTPSPCLLQNSVFESLYGKTEVSLIEPDTAHLILSKQTELSKVAHHEVVNLAGGVAITRLKERPRKVQEELTLKPLTTDNQSYFAKLQHWIYKQKKPSQQSYVVNLDDQYYLFWNSDQFHGHAKVIYKDECFNIPIE